METLAPEVLEGNTRTAVPSPLDEEFVAPAQEAFPEQVVDDTTHDEKIAMANYSKNVGMFIQKLEDLNGQAAKRVLMGLCSPGVNWVLHKYTTQLEKDVFDLAAKLMDSKILMMLAELDKQMNTENTAIAAAAKNAAEVVGSNSGSGDAATTTVTEGNTNG